MQVRSCWRLRSSTGPNVFTLAIACATGGCRSACVGGARRQRAAGERGEVGAHARVPALDALHVADAAPALLVEEIDRLAGAGRARPVQESERHPRTVVVV